MIFKLHRKQKRKRSPKKPSFIKAAVVLLILMSVSLSFFRRKPHDDIPICALVVTESNVKAYALSKMWGGRVSFFTYLLNTSNSTVATTTTPNSLYLTHSSGNLYFFASEQRPSYSMALQGLVQAASTIEVNCQYYFVHKDDVEVMSLVETTTPYEVLQNILMLYMPAILTFSKQEASRSRHPDLKNDGNVAPLTALDEGQVLIHQDIVDFFIPIPPAGEGGFKLGNATHPSTQFWSFFASLVFADHALVARELISFNKGQPDSSTQNAGYTRFLKSGLLDESTRTGGDVLFEDVHYYKILPKRFDKYSEEYVLNRLRSVYDIQHSALSSCQFFKRESVRKILFGEEAMPPPLSLTVFLFGKRRPFSFNRATHSAIEAISKYKAVGGTRIFRVKLVMSIDREWEDVGGYEKVKTLAYDWQNKFPDLIDVEISPNERGLKRTIIEIFPAETDSDFALFVEDDIELSPWALIFAADAISKLLPTSRTKNMEIASLSLYHSQYNDVMMQQFPISECTSYLLQQPVSWGAIFFPWHWRQFLEFYNAFGNQDPVVPLLYSNHWPNVHSWKKYMLRFMAENNLYTLGTSHHRHQSLTTNHVEPGTNEGNDNPLKKLLNVPLVEDINQLCYVQFNIANLLRLDPRLMEVDKLIPNTNSVASFDACTLLLTPVCSLSARPLLDRLLQYTNSTIIEQIVFLLQPCNFAASLDIPTDINGKPIVVKHMQGTDENNRYFPWTEIKYDCIVSSAGDWTMPHDVMDFLFKTWQGHFFHHLLGHSDAAASHFQSAKGGFDLRDNVTSGVSIVLPSSGAIFHRYFLKEYYGEKYQKAREYAINSSVCGDILLNFVISMHVENGPVVIRSLSTSIMDNYESLAKTKLWEYMSNGSACLEEFVNLFGNNVLKYTTSIFDVNKTYGQYGVAPGLQHYAFREGILLA